MSDWWDEELERLSAQVDALRARVDRTKAAAAPPRVPSVAEFVLSDEFLAQPKLYPRQLTLLRTIFCELEHLTTYDRAVLAEWGAGFERPSLHEGTPGGCGSRRPTASS